MNLFNCVSCEYCKLLPGIKETNVVYVIVNLFITIVLLVIRVFTSRKIFYVLLLEKKDICVELVKKLIGATFNRKKELYSKGQCLFEEQIIRLS